MLKTLNTRLGHYLSNDTGLRLQGVHVPGAPVCIVPLIHYHRHAFFFGGGGLSSLYHQASIHVQQQSHLSFSKFFLRTWPIQFYLWRLTWCFLPLQSPKLSCLGFVAAIWSWEFFLGTWSERCISSFLCLSELSHIHKATTTGLGLKRESLVFLPIIMAFQMLSSLLKDAPAIVILFLM